MLGSPGGSKSVSFRLPPRDQNPHDDGDEQLSAHMTHANSSRSPPNRAANKRPSVPQRATTTTAVSKTSGGSIYDIIQGLSESDRSLFLPAAPPSPAATAAAAPIPSSSPASNAAASGPPLTSWSPLPTTLRHPPPYGSHRNVDDAAFYVPSSTVRNADGEEDSSSYYHRNGEGRNPPTRMSSTHGPIPCFDLTQQKQQQQQQQNSCCHDFYPFMDTEAAGDTYRSRAHRSRTEEGEGDEPYSSNSSQYQKKMMSSSTAGPLGEGSSSGSVVGSSRASIVPIPVFDLRDGEHVVNADNHDSGRGAGGPEGGTYGGRDGETSSRGGSVSVLSSLSLPSPTAANSMRNHPSVSATTSSTGAAAGLGNRHHQQQIQQNGPAQIAQRIEEKEEEERKEEDINPNEMADMFAWWRAQDEKSGAVARDVVRRMSAAAVAGGSKNIRSVLFTALRKYQLQQQRLEEGGGVGGSDDRREIQRQEQSNTSAMEKAAPPSMTHGNLGKQQPPLVLPPRKDTGEKTVMKLPRDGSRSGGGGEVPPNLNDDDRRNNVRLLLYGPRHEELSEDDDDESSDDGNHRRGKTTKKSKMRTAQTRPSGGLAEVTGPRGGNPSVWPATFFAGKRLQDVKVPAPPQQSTTTPSSPSQEGANDPTKVSTGMEAEEAVTPRHPHPASSDSASTLLDAALRGDESSPAYRRFYAVVEGKMRRWMLDRSSEDPGYVYEMSRLGENDHIQPGDPPPYNLTEFYQKMTVSDVAPSVMSLFSNAAERKYEAQVEAEMEDWPDPHRMRQWITTRTIPLRETHMLSAGVPELDQLLRSSWTRHASAPAPEPAAPLYTVPPTFPQFEIADVPVQHGGDFFSTFPNNAAFRGGDGAEDRMDYATRDMRPSYRVNDECMPWLADCALYPSPAPWTPPVQPLDDQHQRPSRRPSSTSQPEEAAKSSPAATAVTHRNSGGSMLFPNSAPSANPNYVPDEVLEEIFRSEDDITAQRLAPYSFADRLALARRRRHATHMPTSYTRGDDMDASGVLGPHYSDSLPVSKANESSVGQNGSVASVNSSLVRGSTAAGLPLIDVTAMSTATIGNAAQRAGASYPMVAASSSSNPATSMHGHGAHLAPADAYEFVVKARDAPWRPIMTSQGQGNTSRGGVARTSMASPGNRRLSMSDGLSSGVSPSSNQRGVMRWVDWDDGN